MRSESETSEQTLLSRNKTLKRTIFQGGLHANVRGLPSRDNCEPVCLTRQSHRPYSAFPNPRAGDAAARREPGRHPSEAGGGHCAGRRRGFSSGAGLPGRGRALSTGGSGLRGRGRGSWAGGGAPGPREGAAQGVGGVSGTGRGSLRGRGRALCTAGAGFQRRGGAPGQGAGAARGRGRSALRGPGRPALLPLPRPGPWRAELLPRPGLSLPSPPLAAVPPCPPPSSSSSVRRSSSRQAGSMAAVEARVCETDGCSSEAKLQCPTCIKLGIQGSYFCSQVDVRSPAPLPGPLLAAPEPFLARVPSRPPGRAPSLPRTAVPGAPVPGVVVPRASGGPGASGVPGRGGGAVVRGHVSRGRKWICPGAPGRPEGAAFGAGARGSHPPRGRRRPGVWAPPGQVGTRGRRRCGASSRPGGDRGARGLRGRPVLRVSAGAGVSQGARWASWFGPLVQG